jgi:hypothetical protein
MKELLEKIVTFLPNYLLEFGQLISKPKDFVLSRNNNFDEVFISALIFGAITSVILFVAFFQFLAEGDLWVKFSKYLILSCVGVCLTAASMIIGWKAVGWTGASKSIFVIAIYYNMVMSVIAAAFVLLGIGVMNMLVPEYYAILHNSIKSFKFVSFDELHEFLDNYDGSFAVLYSMIIIGGLSIICGFIFQYIWLFIGWEAFRRMNGFSKGKSGLAFIITMFINVPATWIQFFIAAATMNKLE